MLEHDAFRTREKALENEFFHRVDQKLVAQLRKQLAGEAAKEALASASGVTDQRLLDELVELEISPNTLAALMLVPLVVVAWADGEVEEAERQAVLQLAVKDGLPLGSPSYKLLQFWLENRPSAQLFNAWKHFIVAASEGLSQDAREALNQQLLGQMRNVAQAAGGHLGLGRVSSEEKQVLAEVEQVLVDGATPTG